MKICFVGLENLPVLAPEYNHHGIGGEQVQQTLLAKAFASRGHSVSMVVGDYGQHEGLRYGGITVHKAYAAAEGLPVVRFAYPRWTKVWSALKRADADVYYTSCAGMMVGQLAMFCQRHGRGLVFRLAHDRDADPTKLLIKYRRDKALYTFGLKRADAVLTQHRDQRKALRANYGVDSDVAGMLVDPPNRMLLAHERDLPVLWVNNLREFKRPELALELARRLKTAQVHMVGGPQAGFESLYESIRERAAIVPNLTFHGRVAYHGVGDYYDRARIFVNTSESEGFPNSYLQCWRRGVPVVAFFDPDGVIEQHGLGYTVGSLDEMQAAVRRLLADEAEWSRISRRCLEHMGRYYGESVVLEPYEAAVAQAGRRRHVS